MEDDIIITHLHISSNRNRVFLTAMNDKKLIAKIEEKIKECNEKDIEVWEQKYNIIITEKGYYAAIYNR